MSLGSLPESQTLPLTTDGKARRLGQRNPSARRDRGEIACAECRRLKLKCDRRVPCGSCVRRGCRSICPQGTLVAGHGGRLILADTTELHTKINEMGERIRQLEEALARAHSHASREVHPLLVEPFLSVKHGLINRSGSEQTEQGDKIASDPSLADALALNFGTLTVGNNTESKYFGPSAGSETMILATADVVDEREGYIFAPEADGIFPIVHGANVEETVKSMARRLPVEARARYLHEMFLSNLSWIFNPLLDDAYFFDEILNPVYKALAAKEDDTDAWNTIAPHRLSLLFLVLCLGSLVDLTLSYEEQNLYAEEYFRHGNACLGLRVTFDSPEIATAQTISLIAVYNGASGKKHTMDGGWTLIQLSAKLAQSLGLHRDPSRWNLDSQAIHRRRRLFWELTSIDFLYSCATGRPPSISLQYIDTKFPDEDAKYTPEYKESGDVTNIYYHEKYKFVEGILSSMVEVNLAAKAPLYSTVLDLDRKIRSRQIPPELDVSEDSLPKGWSPTQYATQCYFKEFHTIALLYLHRGYFTQVMLDHPENPLQSPFAPSYLTSYHCAIAMIHKNLNMYNRFPDLYNRFWHLSAHVFSAAMIVGSIVIHSPKSDLTPSAFVALGLVCFMFEKSAKYSRRARSALWIISKLRERAFQVYSQHQVGVVLPEPLSIPTTSQSEDTASLQLFGGQTSFVVNKYLNASKRNARNRSTPPSTMAPMTPPDWDDRSPDLGDAALDSPAQEIHPALADYLLNLPFPETQFASIKVDHQNSDTSHTHLTASQRDPLAPSDVGTTNPWTHQESWTGYGSQQTPSLPTYLLGSQILDVHHDSNSNFGPELPIDTEGSLHPDADMPWMASVRAFGLADFL